MFIQNPFFVVLFYAIKIILISLHQNFYSPALFISLYQVFEIKKFKVGVD